MALSTPLYNLKNFVNVYEPSEDSFLFLDALELEISTIINITPDFVVEIGSGSGVIITALASILKSNSVFFSTDINYEACLATKHTSKLNNINVEVCCMNMLLNFNRNRFDIILFNPPYVVTESTEIQGNSISRAWAGGLHGREVIDKFLPEIPNLLSEKGICYIVVIKENKPYEIKCFMENIGFKMVIVKERKILGEHLFILKICR